MAAVISDASLAQCELVEIEGLFQLSDQIARIVAQQPAGCREQDRCICPAALLRTVAQYQPAEFFRIRQFRVGDQAHPWFLGGSVDLYAGFDRKSLAQRTDVQGRIIEQTTEMQAAAFDIEFLPIGAETALAALRDGETPCHDSDR